MSTYAQLYSRQIRDLIKHHKRNKRNGRLLFAGWYDKENDDGDVNLLEIYEDFPDPGLGKLETFQFPSTADFSSKGSLRLTVTSPSELREAAKRNDPTLASIMSAPDREAIYPEDADWDRYIEELSK